MYVPRIDEMNTHIHIHTYTNNRFHHQQQRFVDDIFVSMTSENGGVNLTERTL